MNTRYCAKAGCGHANQYTAVKPRFCASCGNALDATFASTPFATVQPVAQPAYAPLAPARPQHPATRQPRERVFQPLKGTQTRTVTLGQEGPQHGVPREEEPADDGQFDDSPVDRDAAYAEGMQIAAQLDPASFGISSPVVRVKFGQLDNLREAANALAQEAAAPKKRAPRAKKAQA